MNDKENNIIYTAQDIEQYHAGKLTPLQMHALEKAALDDEFLAEAIEGYGSVIQEEWKDELAALKKEFEKNKDTAKVIALPKRNNNWWKIAAAVLLIGTAVTISYLIFNKKENNQIAQAVKTEIVTDSITTTPGPVAAETTAPAPQVNLNTEARKDKGTLPNNTITAATETIKADSTFVYRPLAKPAEADTKIAGTEALENALAKSSQKAVTTNATPAVTFSNNAINKAAEENKLNYNANSGAVPQAEYAKAKTSDEKDNQDFYKKELKLNRSFAAQVVGPDNTPLPFANISIKAENFGTYADVKGNFRLVSSDSSLTVEVKAAGYKPKLYTLQSGLVYQNKIMLAEDDLVFNQKSIVGYGIDTKKQLSKRATLLKDSVISVEPADGWDNYNTYVNNNIEIPDDILDKNLHGQVEISFDVKPNGTITNIKVDKSLCNNCDEAAKRLLEQGPQWKTKNGKKGKGKITVQF